MCTIFMVTVQCKHKASRQKSLVIILSSLAISREIPYL